MKHLNTADFTASYGVLRVRAAVAIAAIMIAAIATAARTRRTPYEAVKSAVFKCFMQVKLTAFSELERVN